MSIDGTNQIMLATTAGAFAQAMALATKSDRPAREDSGPRRGKSAARARQVRVVAPWRRPLRPAWAFAVSLCIIAIGLDIFSA
jgi:hypothetical protein